MKILIVNKQSLQVASVYEANQPEQQNWGGPWGDSKQFEHIICSPMIDADCAGVEDQDGVLVAVLDEDKVAAKQEILWQALRKDRDLKLAACDWTQVSDSPLNSTDKAAWATYRQALRDLPENTEDPESPIWPSKPNSQI